MNQIGYRILLFLTLICIAVSSHGSVIKGTYYTVVYDDEEFIDNGGEEIDLWTRKAGFMVHQFGDAEFTRWAVGVLEYEITQDVIDKRLKAYFYLPKIVHDDIETGATINFYMTNNSDLTLRDISNHSGMILAKSLDSKANLASYLAPECSEGWQETPFEKAYPFSACNYRPIEIDFLGLSNALTFKPGDTLTIVVTNSDRYWWSTTVGGTSDPYGLLAAGVRLSDQPLQPMASASDIETCNGKVPTLVGTHNDDTIHIPSDADHVVLGLSGDDTIIGNDRQDTICGGANNDKLHGHDGDDYLDGGTHADMILAGAGNDKLNDTSGANILIGAGGNDDLIGNPMSTCQGGGGHDSVNTACGIKGDIEIVQP